MLNMFLGQQAEGPIAENKIAIPQSWKFFNVKLFYMKRVVMNIKDCHCCYAIVMLA